MELPSSSPSPAPSSWFAELDGEEPMMFQEFVGDWLADYPLEDLGVVLDDDLRHSHSSGSECKSSNTAADVIGTGTGTGTGTGKRQKFNDHHPWSPNTTGPDKPEDRIVSFASFSSNSSSSNNNNDNNSNAKSAQKSSVKSGRSSTLSPDQQQTTTLKRPKRQLDQCHNHIIAERQRRQNLSQGFIALSALIPGLKKMDKTSVLGEAINHMKQLKERLKVLEEENSKRGVESVVVVKRSRVIAENDTTSSSNNEDKKLSMSSDVDDQFPEIEARFCDKSVLIKIHCAVHKGILTKVVGEIEKLHLCVTTANAMSFNGGTLDITIIAQMESEFELTPWDVVNELRSIFH